MKISIKALIAPWVGAGAGWLAAHGLALTPAQTLALVMLSAGLVSNVVHIVEQMVLGKIKPLPPPAAAAAKSTADISKKLAVVLCLMFAGGSLAALSGCSSSGSLVKSPDEAIYAGFGAYVAAEQALTQAVETRAISPTAAQKLDASLQVAYIGLNAARAAEQSAPATSSQKLEEAIAAIDAVQAAIEADTGATQTKVKP